jgi:L-ribulose-5-phosphate 4-epimerase
MTYSALREEVYKANMQLPELGLVIYTFGNVSAIDREKGVIGIKPSGVAYESLKPEDIVIVDLEHKIVAGKMKPSSDTDTHVVLYNNFQNIGGIVHTHSTYATAWAQAKMPVPILGTTHADHAAADIPCTEIMSNDMIRGNYEIETGNQILETFTSISHKEIEMVLVAGHGPFSWGKDAAKAVYNSVVLEQLAEMAYLTLQINPSVDRLKDTLIRKHYQRKHGKDAYYGQQ